MRMRNMFVTSAAALGAVALLAAPAVAHEDDDLGHIGIFQGCAEVFAPTIGLPALPQPSVEASWVFNADPNNAVCGGVATGSGGIESWNNPPPNADSHVCKDLQQLTDLFGANADDCKISAEGKLGAVGPGVLGVNLGPWCGMSQGYHGEGSYTDAAASGTVKNDHELKGLGWVASAGSILPVNGHFRDLDDGTVPPAPDPDGDGSDAAQNNGTVIALVQAFGADLATDCQAGMAGVFNVRGIAVLN